MFTAALLCGPAAVWYRHYASNHDVNNLPYHEFRAAIVQEFMDFNLVAKARAKLRSIKQG